MTLQLSLVLAPITICMTLIAVPVVAVEQTNPMQCPREMMSNSDADATRTWLPIFPDGCGYGSFPDFLKVFLIPKEGMPLHDSTASPEDFMSTGKRLAATDFVFIGASRSGFTCVCGTSAKIFDGNATGIHGWVKSSNVIARSDVGSELPLSSWVGDWKSDIDSFTEIVVQSDGNGTICLTLKAALKSEANAKIPGCVVGNRLEAGDMAPLHPQCHLNAMIVSQKMLVTDDASCGGHRSTFFFNILSRTIHKDDTGSVSR